MYETAAKRLNLPVEHVRRAMYFAEWKARLATRPDGRFILKKAAKLRREITLRFNRQQEYIIHQLSTLSVFQEKCFRIESKTLSDDLRISLEQMPDQDGLAEEIAAASAITLLKGGRATIRVHRLSKIGISWDLSNKRAVDYLSQLRTLNLSDREGSINKTTKDRIIEIIRDGAINGDTYSEMAKKIKDLSSAGIFSPARAEMIATNELAKAYEYGSAQPMLEAEQATGDRVFKRWLTVGDDKVTEECQANEEQGWISIHEQFKSGHGEPPRFPRCRCTTVYEFGSNMSIQNS